MAIESVMSGVMQSGVAAMQQAQADLATSGQRVANLVKPVEASSESGLRADAEDGVDLAEESVDQILASNQFSAGAALVRAGDKMTRTLLDLFA